MTGATRGVGNAISEIPAFTLFGDFMISHIHCIYTLLDLSVFGIYVRINDCGLFACISLAASSQTYFIACEEMDFIESLKRSFSMSEYSVKLKCCQILLHHVYFFEVILIHVLFLNINGVVSP